MAATGSNYFKWPNPPDQTWYRKANVKEASDAPRLLKRGCYEFPEMCKHT